MLKIANIQFGVSHWNPDQNLKRMSEFIQTAKQNQADLVIFPEDAVIGWMLKNPVMIEQNNNFINFFVNQAKTHKIDIIPGSWMTKIKDKIYNTTHYINSKGHILNTYKKVNLWISRLLSEIY